MRTIYIALVIILDIILYILMGILSIRCDEDSYIAVKRISVEKL
jgi:hypothetical protein